ncbi:hypothetical protein V5O48_003879 [Marasmius crinis-equi]|uniref:P-loop containing nucleoside triphosphate hydrolase protein n=1 Tax=Marasmius crinis-equi TaxID=585013 RepID=A0ABR3FRL0_9AGAR
MDAIKSLVQPLVGGAGGSGVIDGMKLVVLGGTVETARRVSSSAWSHFVNSFFLTAHFSEEDYPYDWLMLWLSRRPEWQRSREFDTTTRSTTPGISGKIADNSFGDEDFLDHDDPLNTSSEYGGNSWGGMGADDDAPGKVKTRVVFQPTFDMTHTIYYRGHWLRIKRGRKQDGCEDLSISVVARSNTILKQLVLQAKREYEAEAIHRIQIYFADSHGSWRWTDSRHKRPMSSIVLNPGVKEMLLADTKDFLASEKWYADRGIPFRRGYLLHGVPGSGKSSLIHAIAGELMLDIYVVSLSSSWISDSTLTTLMGRVPARCIVLLEDLDAAFTRSVTREKEKKEKDQNNNNGNNNGNSNNNSSSNNGGRSSGRRRRNDDSMSDTNTLSLSGLLNALDGVAAAEGRILFATTNHLDRLDPALSRPGRMDVWVEFKNASKWQAEALFRNFFPSVEDEEPSPSSSRSASRSTSAAPESRSRADSVSSAPPPPEEEIMLTKEEEDELEKMGIQLPSPPSEAGRSRSPSAAPAPTSTPPPPPRTASTSSFSSWLSTPPQTPSVSSISSALWSLPSLAGSTASLLGGGAAPSPATRARTLSQATPPSAAHSRSRTMSQVSSSPLAQHSEKAPASPPAFGSTNQAYLPPPPSPSVTQPSHSARPLSKETLNTLARKFAEGIPEEEFSVAALQGYLLKNKSRPEEAADEVGRWVEGELEGRRRREERRKEREGRREEKERKEKEKEAKEKKEKEAKEAKEKAEKEAKEKEEKEKAAAAAATTAAESASAPAPATVTPAAPSSESAPAPAAEPAPAPASPSQPTPAGETEPVVVSLPESEDSSSSSSSEDDDDDDSDEENLPPGVRSRAERARGGDWAVPQRGYGWD